MRTKLLEKRRDLCESIYWGFPWNKKKIKEIDDQIWSIDKFMYTTAKLRLHREQPYWGQVELNELMSHVRSLMS